MKRLFHILLFILVANTLLSQSGKSPVKSVYISNIPKPTSPADLEISAISFSDHNGNINNLLDADESAEVSFIVTNKGKGKAYHLEAVVKEIIAVKGTSLSAGKGLKDLSPGEQCTVTIPVSGSRQLETGKEEIDIQVKEGNHFDADPFRLAFNTQKFRNPQLVIADYKFTSGQEGRIRLGQSVSLVLVIQNQGQGEANGVKISFVNPPDVFPAAASVFELGKLSANQSKNLQYEFFANKQYKGNVIEIGVTAEEDLHQYGTQANFSVSLEQSLAKTQEVAVTGKYNEIVSIEKVSLSSDVDSDIPLLSNQDENKYALIIGNEDYASFQQNLSSEMNVAFASNDAIVFKAYCLKTLGIPQENITFGLNATAGQIYQAIDKMSKIIKATNGKADVIVYYAGHGLPDEKTREPFMIPVDVSGSNLNSAIKLSYLYARLSEFPSKRITVFMDACFSGGSRDESLVAARGVKVTPRGDFLKGNMVVFAASSGDQSSLPWKQKQHGMFTYYLLKQLQQSKAEITYAELDQYLREKVELESIKVNNKEQQPEVLYSEEVKDSWGKWRLR